MIAACPTLDSAAPVMASLAQYLDCQADRIGAAGFSGIDQGVLPAGFLNVCLTLFIAVYGYRLLLGGTGISPRTPIFGAVRFGLVLALCTSWPVYQTVVVNVVQGGSEQVAAAILRPLGLPLSAPAAIAAELQTDFDQIEMRASTAPPPAPSAPVSAPPANVVVIGASAISPLSAPETLPQIMLMAGTLISLVGVKFAGAILLAIGPLIVALCLFDAFLPLAASWFRALLGVVIAGVATRLVVAAQMQFLNEVVLARAVSTQIPQADPALGPTAAVFLALDLVVVTVAFLAAGKLKWPRFPAAVRSGAIRKAAREVSRSITPENAGPTLGRSRALVTVDALRRSTTAELAAESRVDASRGQGAVSQGSGLRPRPANASGWTRSSGLTAPVTRRVKISPSTSAARRDLHT